MKGIQASLFTLLTVAVLFTMACAVSVTSTIEDDTDDMELVFSNAQQQLDIRSPEQRSSDDPLILVHYMPWFESPPIHNGYGIHWHLGGGEFDPYEIIEDGRANIASHYYPLTGPYDSSDRNILRYQAALMKIAGIDGVIFDWYGISDALDYASIHESTKAMIEVLREAGLTYAICYEDSSISRMIEANVIQPQDDLTTAHAVMDYMEAEWFRGPAYLRIKDRPALFFFGPQYFKTGEGLEELLMNMDTRPFLVTLDNQLRSFVDASYPWPPMWKSDGGILSLDSLVDYLNEFYSNENDSPYLISSAFTGFHDVYDLSAYGESFGYLDDYAGRTFQLTFEAALQARADLIQIVTWNDYGEGTIIEPTIERGYRDLEYLQNHRRDRNPEFPFTAEDLRIPLEVYRKQIDTDTVDSIREELETAWEALFAGDYARFRRSVSFGNIVVNEESNPILMEIPEAAALVEADIYDSSGKENLALAKDIRSSSSIYDYQAINAVDGQTATYWEGGPATYPNELIVDLGETHEIEAVVLKLNPRRIWAARTQSIEIQLGEEEANFATHIPASGFSFDPINQNTVSITINARTRYMKLIFTSNSEASAGQVAELEIYGK